jgi:hypothetical protein
VRAQQIQDGAVALAEVAAPLAVEEKDLRVPEGRVEPHRHLVLDAPRAEPFGVDLAAVQLAPRDEIRELQRAKVARHLVVVADRMLVL